MAKSGRRVLFTNEYPPQRLWRRRACTSSTGQALAKRIAVEVRCFGEQRGTAAIRVRGYPSWAEPSEEPTRASAGALDAFQRSLAMAKDTLDGTWSTATPGTPTWAA